jgi:ATPase subunit of ABC transporter with duplicated ATPase domains
LITTANNTLQFGAKSLFENVCVKFCGGNRYGLIGANGCAKSTFLKILCWDLEPTAGNIAVDRAARIQAFGVRSTNRPAKMQQLIHYAITSFIFKEKT